MRYLVLPLNRPEFGAVLRRVANAIHMTPLGHDWDVNQIWRIAAYVVNGMPIPEDAHSPIISPDIDPESSGILELLMMSSREERVFDAGELINRLSTVTISDEDIRRLRELVLSDEERTTLANHQHMLDMIEINSH